MEEQSPSDFAACVDVQKVYAFEGNVSTLIFEGQARSQREGHRSATKRHRSSQVKYDFTLRDGEEEGARQVTPAAT